MPAIATTAKTILRRINRISVDGGERAGGLGAWPCSPPARRLRLLVLFVYFISNALPPSEGNGLQAVWNHSRFNRPVIPDPPPERPAGRTWRRGAPGPDSGTWICDPRAALILQRNRRPAPAALRRRRSSRRCSTLKNVGTKTERRRWRTPIPPMTARPSGAFCSPPSPRPRARQPCRDHGQGSHRHRTEADEPGGQARRPSIPDIGFQFSRAKLTTRIELAVATPMATIGPGQRRHAHPWVPVTNKNPHDPRNSAAGRAATIRKGSSHDWKLTTISR